MHREVAAGDLHQLDLAQGQPLDHRQAHALQRFAV
jgi:hypothetical protein